MLAYRRQYYVYETTFNVFSTKHHLYNILHALTKMTRNMNVINCMFSLQKRFRMITKT